MVCKEGLAPPVVNYLVSVSNFRPIWPDIERRSFIPFINAIGFSLPTLLFVHSHKNLIYIFFVCVNKNMI